MSGRRRTSPYDEFPIELSPDTPVSWNIYDPVYLYLQCRDVFVLTGIVPFRVIVVFPVLIGYPLCPELLSLKAAPKGKCFQSYAQFWFPGLSRQRATNSSLGGLLTFVVRARDMPYRPSPKILS
ncbi:hypothetical protein NDU88_004792 [Pleurodeles waltl]|uniref:Uncharacterized protein n=1 Tax=Pleurodeles waltl TaxID=8319 RepID=A0AAV7VH88_PLEWA|nr:hypothetical protein NDU88_004792 [Pleurodeles waltl]